MHVVFLQQFTISVFPIILYRNGSHYLQYKALVLASIKFYEIPYANQGYF